MKLSQRILIEPRQVSQIQAPASSFAVTCIPSPLYISLRTINSLFLGNLFISEEDPFSFPFFSSSPSSPLSLILFIAQSDRDVEGEVQFWDLLTKRSKMIKFSPHSRGILTLFIFGRLETLKLLT